MIDPIPSVDVWQSKADPNQILIWHKGALFDRHENHPFYAGNVTVGIAERYSVDEFRRLGLELIKKSLQEFPNRMQTEPCPPSELDRMSKKTKAAFFDAHRIVGIGPERGMLRLDPIYHRKVGVKGGSKAPRYVPFDADPNDFMGMLTECFATAD